MTRSIQASVFLVVLLALAGIVPGAGRQRGPAERERAYRANNLGVARLEQFDYDAAAQSFREALQIDPGLTIGRLNLALALFYANNAEAALHEARLVAERLPEAPQVHYLLGLLARSLDRPEEAIASWRRVLQHDSSDVGTKVNLGQVYLQQRSFGDAIVLFREALAAEPYNVTAAYNLATALIRSGAADEGRQAMNRFQTLRDSTYGKTYSQTYLEQGKYAEAIASTGAEPELVDTRTPAVTFADATAAAFPQTRSARSGSGAIGEGLVAAVAGGVTLFDADGDGDLDLIETGPTGSRLYRNDAGVFSDISERAGLTASARGASIGAIAADYDNDGRPDLFILRYGGNLLLRQTSGAGFEDVTERSRLPAYPDLARSAAFVDVDHDGDLDILVVGFAGSVGPQSTGARGELPDSLTAAPNQLLRNNGNGTFTDITAAAGVTGGGNGVAVVATDFDNRRDIDLLIVNRGAAPVLLQNLRDGSFRDAARDAGLPPAARYTCAAAGDVNKDGTIDFFFGRSDGPGAWAMSDGSGRFVVRAGPESSRGAVAAQLIDYDNDGLLDLFILSNRGAHLFRNLGTGWSDVSEAAALTALAAGGVEFQAMALGDVDGDGDTDALVRLADGTVRHWRNQGGNRNPSLRVRLAGRVSNRTGVGSKVDLRAGSLRQRLESSAVVPAVAPADLIFGLGAHRVADVLRVLWPSGTLQAETDFGPVREGPQPGARVVTVTELDRKPSSCPYLYTWNGSRFEFVTDFMGGGEIGYWVGPEMWNRPDPDEYVRIRGDQLEPRNGRYELRVTNELEEALFIDRLQLVAVDHAEGVEIYPNEGLGAPAPVAGALRAPGFGVTTTRGARVVAGATDEHGHDVRARVERIDRTYPDDFTLRSIRGYAEPHTLTLDLGDRADRAVLLMTGWTDYAFSGDNVAAHQSGQTLSPPALQVKDPRGIWRTAIEDIGIPIGRPQTVVVNLRGKVPPSTREVRVVTNMRIYWDQVLVDSSGGGFSTVLTRLDPVGANLRWRGFSAESTPDGRQPFGYDYQRVATVSPWKVMTGRYTREGDVRPLLTRSDDMFVVSRPGDEIALSFNASSLPSLQPGLTRTFLLYVVGYSKEMDVNSASPHTVEPLPFHGMSSYPYGPGESYPRTPAHLEYLARYNTRTVSRPLPPLEIVK
ncbi:MAG: FG-GAP-like repeat-containing protein [Vicinamibacterales bacterium]